MEKRHNFAEFRLKFKSRNSKISEQNLLHYFMIKLHHSHIMSLLLFKCKHWDFCFLNEMLRYAGTENIIQK